MEQIFLEDWLRMASSPSSSSFSAPATESTPEFAANAVVHAWAEIRACVQLKSVTDAQRAALELLFRHRRSLHYADSQVKLLLALMTDVACNDAALLGYARKFAVLGVLAWVRKCYTGTAVSPSVQKQGTEKLASVVQTLKKAMDDHPTSDVYACEGILLLGVVSNLAMVSPDLRSECCSLIAVEFGARKKAIVRGSIAEALAGAGYALSVCQEQHLASIYRPMLQLWTSDSPVTMLENISATPSTGLDGAHDPPSDWENPPLKDVIMLLHLLDYLGSQFLSRYAHEDPLKRAVIELLYDEVLRLPVYKTGREVQCATIMVSFGLLRSLYRYIPGKVSGVPVKVLYPNLSIMLRNLEGIVYKVCDQVIAPDVSMSTFGSSVGHGGAYADGVFRQTQNMLSVRCVAVGLSRCPGFPAHPGVLHCLIVCIFEDVLRLSAFYSAYLDEAVSGLIGGRQNDISDQGRDVDDLDAVFVAFQVHTESFVFQEVGALARALCEQYRKSREDQQGQTVQYIWEYARNLQASHRVFVATSGKPPSQTGFSHHARTMEKFLEAVFLTVVVFFHTAVVKDAPGERSAVELPAVTLDTFSCVEFFRNLHLKEYIEVIKATITRVSDSEAGSVSLVEKFPHYSDIIQRPGPLHLTLTYYWDGDEVQSSRILFYFRVLPLCLDTLPDAVFVQRIAPVLFLYLQYPLEATTKAAHALFGAFLSSKMNPEARSSTRKPSISSVTSSEIEPDFALREQLVGYYARRALELFPDVTPFKGLVSGFNAIARHLRSGSPALVYCLSRLTERTKALYNSTQKTSERDLRASQDPGSPTESARVIGGEQPRKVSVEDMGGAEKLQALLLHLILIVDLQVLPELLKLVASLILGLPLHQQTVALREVYDIVAVTDDYTRKPVVIPWLQTLSFHLSNNQSQAKRTLGSRM